MLEVLTNDVQARCSGDTTVLADRAVRRQDRHVQPGVVWTVAGGDEHRADVLAGKAQSRTGSGMWTGVGRTAGKTSRLRPAAST